jgi:flagellar hook assembly protein FlgD
MPDISQANKAVSVSELMNRDNDQPKNVKIVRNATDSLDRNSFLKLLVTQLSKQDPLQPMNDREFISQMAQFSALEQMNNVAGAMNSLKSFQAGNLVGKNVIGKDFINGKLVSGTVNEVFYDKEQNVFLRVNGRTVKLKDIQSISMAKAGANVSRETSSVDQKIATDSYNENQKKAYQESNGL